uniref:Auxin-responsive protein n=1 Tax=Salix viminalis TaxID=40686 RepID=A0A6N2LHM7_SALVM
MEVQCLHRRPQKLPSEVKGRHTKVILTGLPAISITLLSVDTSLPATSIVSYTQKMSNSQEDNKKKVKKGCIAVRVGLEEKMADSKICDSISYLYHPLFKRLLEKAHEVYGYHTTGPLWLPCSVDDFLHLRWRIERGRSSEPPQSLQQHLLALIFSLLLISCRN